MNPPAPLRYPDSRGEGYPSNARWQWQLRNLLKINNARMRFSRKNITWSALPSTQHPRAPVPDQYIPALPSHSWHLVRRARMGGSLAWPLLALRDNGSWLRASQPTGARWQMPPTRGLAQHCAHVYCTCTRCFANPDAALEAEQGNLTGDRYAPSI
jgi:hypothetical protein